MANKNIKDDVVNEVNTEQQTEDSSKNNTENKNEAQKKTAKKGDKKKTAKKKKPSASEVELDKTIKELEEWRYKTSEINDKYMRLSAEFDNYRKRTLKEKTELLKTAGGNVLADILPVIDDFERAMLSMENADNITAVKEGIDLIYNKFKDFLKAKGIVEIEAMHQEFDTDLHEALTKIPAPTKKLKGKVVDIIQKGYKIEDKVIRYAQVVVGE